MTSGRDIADSDTTDCGSFFDHVDDLLDVPDDDDNAGCSRLPIHLDTFPYPDSFFSNSAELSVPPYDDIVHLEWLSTFGEDPFSGGHAVADLPTGSLGEQLPDHGAYVLDSTSSCSLRIVAP
ncbi:hypothetical protein MLD38_024366 [Melastoma candidum]|uniref:Uncharacterized protein n=1 Tax=Melastoma candidum TaxID=119954 RepID=A0ACB9NS22_9MYRT|nr:hypothetical protein MLD38_024366 [Melastoma candidum]